MGDGFDGEGFAAEAADLGEAGDAGLYEGADVEAGHDLGELEVVLDEVGTGADYAHLAAEDVDELGKFVDGVAAEETAGGEEAGGIGGAVGGGRGMHGAEFPDDEFAVLDACADLSKEERAGGLEAMDDPDEESERREEKGDYEEGEEDIKRTFEHSVKRVLEGLLMKGEEVETVVLEHGDGVAEALGEITEDKEARAGTLDGIDEGGGGFAELDEKDLIDAMGGDDL